MTVEELTRLFQRGALLEAVVEPYSYRGLWLLAFTTEQGELIVTTDESGEERHFSTADDACRQAMRIGFSQARVEQRTGSE